MVKHRTEIQDRLTGEIVYRSRYYPTYNQAADAAERACKRQWRGDRYRIKEGESIIVNDKLYTEADNA